jgi:hypothetical protein
MPLLATAPASRRDRIGEEKSNAENVCAPDASAGGEQSAFFESREMLEEYYNAMMPGDAGKFVVPPKPSGPMIRVLMPDGQEVWWELTDNTDPEEGFVKRALTVKLPTP